MNFNADVFLPCLQNIEICIHKLKQLGLLNRDQRCPNCQEMCFWTKYSKSKDGWAWKCQTKLCQNYKNYISIRKGSFFANSNIPLPKWLHLMVLELLSKSTFSHKPKHHRGRAAEIPIWVFGIVDSFKPSVGFMEIVENRGAEIYVARSF